jgi:transcriptional regulator with XRE-family HTH domain
VEEPDDSIAFGERLKEFRCSQRLTQGELAGDRYSHAYISQLESGRRQPSKESLVYIAERLGVSVEELSSGRGANWAVEMAEDLRAQGLQREAYELLEKTLTNLECDGQVSGAVLSVMHRELGLLQRSHDLVIAEKHLRQAAELALEHGAPVADAAQALAGWGEVLTDQGDVEGALTAYRKATELLIEHLPLGLRR